MMTRTQPLAIRELSSNRGKTKCHCCTQRIRIMIAKGVNRTLSLRSRDASEHQQPQNRVAAAGALEVGELRFGENDRRL